jgi:hypothetical protein
MGVIAVAALAVATMAYAQKPDFSGAWTPDQSAAQPGGGGGGGRGMMAGPMTVKQTADTLTVERAMGENKMTLTYKLDGSPSTNTMMGRGGQSMEAKSVAKWDGDKLVITTTRDMGGQTMETTETWSVDGSTLTIERTGGRGSSKTVYKK